MNRLESTIISIDQYNGQDPNQEYWEHESHPKELLYSKRMTDWLSRLNPNAHESLQIAARAQHIGRWTIPRDKFSRDKKGYLKWRTQLKLFHAQKVGEIMEVNGYNAEEIKETQALIKKEKLKTNPNTQLLEDVICLVFLEYYFVTFAKTHPEEKIIQIVKKTWVKMSEKGHEYALKLKYDVNSKALLSKALQ